MVHLPVLVPSSFIDFEGDKDHCEASQKIDIFGVIGLGSRWRFDLLSYAVLSPPGLLIISSSDS